VFGANQVGAPHRRNRVWVVATSDADRGRVWDESGGFFRQGWGSSALAWKHDEARTVADADCERRDGRTRVKRTGRWAELADGGRTGGGSWWSSERGLGRVAPRQPHRVDRLRALGNAVVPACAELVGLRLLQLDGGRETWLVNR
jgi:DNA (cytosine-5)-methyltransferase 1